MVTIEVENVKSRVLGHLRKETITKLEETLSYELPGARYMQRYHPLAGTRRFFSRYSYKFPTGLIHYVRAVLTNEGIRYNIVDKRIAPQLGPEIPIYGFELRDYQKSSVATAVKSQRGIIKVGTGGGKTNILIGIVSKLNIPTLILIHKIDIFYQIYNRLKESLKIPIGRVGDGHCDIQRITVGMIQTISYVYDHKRKKKKKQFEPEVDVTILSKADKIRYLIDNVQCILTDECHHCPADSFWMVHKASARAYYKIGLSASPWRDDNADLLIEAANAKQIVDISASTLIDMGYLVKPKLYYLNYKHVTKFRPGAYSDIYDEEVVNNIERNKVIVNSAIAAASAGKTVLIAVRKIEHGKILEDMLKTIEPNTTFAYGEVGSEERQLILKELDERKRNIVICTTIFGEGIDVPNLDVLVNAKAAKSSVDSFQLLGRVLRKTPQKSKAYIIDIADSNCKYLLAHAKARLKIYKTEPNYLIEKITSPAELSFEDDTW